MIIIIRMYADCFVCYYIGWHAQSAAKSGEAKQPMVSVRPILFLMLVLMRYADSVRFGPAVQGTMYLFTYTVYRFVSTRGLKAMYGYCSRYMHVFKFRVAFKY